MKRLHLVELEDLPWWPAVFRDACTDFLQTFMTIFRPYHKLIPRLASAIKHCRSSEVLDICSGAGGPWGEILPALREQGCDVIVRLSDKFPNVKGLDRARRRDPGIQPIYDSVDATDVPPNLQGFRTLFTGLHHLPPELATAILAAAARDRRGIAVCEFTHRSVWSIVLMLLTPLAVLLLTPFVRPFRWSRLFWTYIIPVIPFFIAFDGVVSCFRTYTPDELRGMLDSINATDYQWEIGTEYYPLAGTPITYLIGLPGEVDVNPQR